jgi:hypothetical protein
LIIFKRFLVGFCFLLAIGMVLTGVVEAHAGGKMQIASEDAGAFKLTVWTSPDPARTGEIHVAVAVASAETALPILDANVHVQLISLSDQGDPLTEQATTEDSVNQFLYESIFDIQAEGLYSVTVTVSEADGQEGQVTFELQVEPAPPLIFGIVSLIILAAVTGGAIWLYLRWTAPPSEPQISL